MCYNFRSGHLSLVPGGAVASILNGVPLSARGGDVVGCRVSADIALCSFTPPVPPDNPLPPSHPLSITSCVLLQLSHLLTPPTQNTQTTMSGFNIAVDPQFESIYNLVPLKKEEVVKPAMYRSRHNPLEPITVSVITSCSYFPRCHPLTSCPPVLHFEQEGA